VVTLRVLAALVCLGVLGCPRKAPGPAECERAAFGLVGVTDRRMLRDRRIKAVVDEITVECLTAPYDRALLECFEQTDSPNACYQGFQLRHGVQRAQRRHQWTR
jgi:hypothetical protein